MTQNRKFRFIENMVLLRGCSLFSSLTPSELRRLSAASKSYDCSAGDTVIMEGDTQEQFYIIASGRVELRIEKESSYVVVESKGEGEFIGELSLFLQGYQSAYTITAVEETKLLSISRDDFYEMLQENPAVSIKIIEYFASKEMFHEEDMASLGKRRIDMFNF